VDFLERPPGGVDLAKKSYRTCPKSEPVYDFLIRKSHFLCLIKPLRFQLRVHYKAAIILGRICERRGLSISPSSLNDRSQSQLNGSILSISSAI